MPTHPTQSPPPTERKRFRAGVWRLADPKITLASAAGLLLGSVFAAVDGAMHWGWWALTWLGIFCIEAAKNAAGEVFDLDTDRRVADADRSPFSGGKRVIVDGLMSARAAGWTAAVFFGLGALAGVAIVIGREPRVLGWGLAGFALAYAYNGPPFRLAYRGLGEIAVAIAYGPIIGTGTYLVQRGEISTPLLAAAVPLGGAIAAFLWVNEFPDHDADRRSGKRNLVVRLGRERAARWFAGLLAVSFLAPAALALRVGEPGLLGCLLGAPLAFRAARRLLRSPTVVRDIIPAQRDALLAFLLHAIGVSVGVGWISRLG